MRGEYEKLLEDFAEAAKEEIASISARNLSEQSGQSQTVSEMKERLKLLIKDLATSGDSSGYKWPFLRQALSVVIKDAGMSMIKKYPDFPEKAGDSADSMLCDLLELFLLFEEEAPFTLQRICEVILEPEQYYTSAYKYLYALERLFNISPYYGN